MTTVARLEDNPSGIGFLHDGSPIVVSMEDQLLLRSTPNGLVWHSDLSVLGGIRINDLATDGRGGAFVGHIASAGRDGDYEANGQPVDNIVRVEPDGSARVVAQSLRSPNGMWLSEDGRRLVVAETRGRRLTEFRVHADGELSSPTTFASTGLANPDGICGDVTGGIWFGSPTTKEFIRVERGGTVTDRIDVAPAWAIACVLGGSDRRTLFMVLADATVPRVLQHKNRVAGSLPPPVSWIETMTVPLPGAGFP
jgi:sugar lactone lactonase YvrE